MEIAPTDGFTKGHREPTEISLVVIAIPNIPVREHRPMIEKVWNSMPGMAFNGNLLTVWLKSLWLPDYDGSVLHTSRAVRASTLVHWTISLIMTQLSSSPPLPRTTAGP